MKQLNVTILLAPLDLTYCINIKKKIKSFEKSGEGKDYNKIYDVCFRYHIVFSQLDEEHLKFVGKLYDECHETLLQFATFMAGSQMVESTAPLPEFHRLVTEFHLELDVAFLFTRPGIVARVMEECGKEDGPSYMEAISLQLKPLVETIKTLQPERTWEDLSPELIALFWSLTLYDIRVPCDSYQREITKLKHQLSIAQAAQRKPNFSDSYGAYPPSSSGAKPKKEIERIQNLTEKLKDEKTKHKNHVNLVLDKLKEEKDNWFVLRSQRPAKNEMITQFLQMCIFPRCMSSALDAHYCAHFIHTLHSVHAANFSTLLCYDRLFCDISYTVTSCTENEANRYSLFALTPL
jgi:THO complex subunit 2